MSARNLQRKLAAEQRSMWPIYWAIRRQVRLPEPLKVGQVKQFLKLRVTSLVIKSPRNWHFLSIHGIITSSTL